MTELVQRSGPATSERSAEFTAAEQRLRILIIEDNRDAARALALLLRLLGHEVEVAYSGPDGVATAHRVRPDVVLSDIGLPGLDGWEVAREIRRDRNSAGALLIAITGYGTDEDRRRAREVGFDYFLTKPADPDMLLSLLPC